MNNILQMLSQIKQNPMQILSQRFNLPQNLNNPNDIINHLVKSGQVSQDQLNKAQEMAKQLKR